MAAESKRQTLGTWGVLTREVELPKALVNKMMPPQIQDYEYIAAAMCCFFFA